MLNLLKEYSKKSPYLSRFKLPEPGSEFELSGFEFEVPGTSYKVVLEARFWISCCVVALIYFIAIESKIEWFYLISAGGISILLLGAFYPYLQVRDVLATCALPPDGVAGDRLRVRVRLRRSVEKSSMARLFPIKWMVVRIKLVGDRHSFSVLRPITVDTIANEAWVVAQSPPLPRGVYRIERVETYSCFPFGLAWWSRNFPVGVGEKIVDNPIVTVYPRVSGVEGNFLYRLRAAGSTALISSATRASSTMTSASVRSLRDFVTGDSPRFIHWASSAKAGKLVVREFDSEGLPGYDMLIDLTAGWKNIDQFELAVSISNSLLNFGFRMGGAPELYVIPDLYQDPEHMPLCLVDLPSLPPGIARWAQLLARVEAVYPKSEEYEPMVPDFGSDGKLALLSVRPAQVVEGAPRDYDIDKKVDIWVMSRAYRQAASSAEKAEDWAMSQRGVIPAHAGFSDRRSASGPLGRVLTSLSSFEEIARL